MPSRTQPAWRPAVALLLALATAWSVGPSAPAAAATLTVTTTADELNSDGDCSLREAVRAANTDAPVDACGAGVGADIVMIPVGTFTLSLTGSGDDAALTGDLDLLQPVVLVGSGRDATVIDGAGADRVLHVLSAGVALQGLTVRNGVSGGFSGAGIYIDNGALSAIGVSVVANVGNSAGIHVGSGSSLTLTEAIVAANSGASAGGIFITSDATVVIERSLISDNSVGFDGGGMNVRGNLTLINVTLSANLAQTDGGAILADDATIRMFNTTITANTADVSGTGGDGGGLALLGSTTVTTTNTLIAGNVDLSATGNVHPDCSGAVTSGGYTLLGDSAGCTLTAGAGDLIGVDPLVGALADNDGPTLTHALQTGSPAIDAGDPSGCRVAAGVRLWLDQRGYGRINRCDIGAFEYGSNGEPLWLQLPSLANAAAP
ncbi:MAG: CSLREA domain-containing protein [Anaerolineales bacterium]|nr:CSLREA domain-containing protein [Anaerolineales bacterium]